MVSQELINWVSIPDPENSDLRFDESSYERIQQVAYYCCPICDKKMQQKGVNKWGCSNRHCLKLRKDRKLKLGDFL